MKYNNIFEAVYANDIEAISKFLPDYLEDKTIYGVTPLLFAIQHNQYFPTIEFLLKNHADPNVVCKNSNNNEVNVFDLIWKYGEPEWISTFVEYGADINALNSQGETVLYLFCKNIHKNFYKINDLLMKYIKEMVRCGAEFNTERSNILPFLSEQRKQELLQYKANLDAAVLSDTKTNLDFYYRI